MKSITNIAIIAFVLLFVMGMFDVQDRMGAALGNLGPEVTAPETTILGMERAEPETEPEDEPVAEALADQPLPEFSEPEGALAFLDRNRWRLGAAWLALFAALSGVFAWMWTRNQAEEQRRLESLEALTAWAESFLSSKDRTRDPKHLVENWLRSKRRNGKLSCMYTGYEIQKYYNGYGEAIDYPWSNVTHAKLLEVLQKKNYDVEKSKRHILKHYSHQYYRMGVQFFLNPLAPTQACKDQAADNNIERVVRATRHVMQVFGLEKQNIVRNLRTSQEKRNKEDVVARMQIVRPNGQVVNAVNQIKVHEYGDGQSLADARHDISTARRQVIMDGDQTVMLSPVRINAVFTVTPDNCTYKRINTDWVEWSLDATSQAVMGFGPEDHALRGDFIRRKLNGLCCDEATRLRLAEGCAEVAKIEAVEKLARAAERGAAAAGLSKTSALRAAKVMGLDSKYNRLLQTPLLVRKSDTTRRAAQLERMREECIQELRSQTRSASVWSAVFVGIALTPMMIAALAPAAPQQPAKRDPIIVQGKPSAKINPSVKYDLLGTQSKMSPVWYDRTDNGVVEASYIGRVAKDNGIASREGVYNLYKGTKFLLHSIMGEFREEPLIGSEGRVLLDKNGDMVTHTSGVRRNDDLVLNHDSMREYIESRNWARNKKDKHLKVLETCIPDVVTVEWLRSQMECSAFIKDEFYTESRNPHQEGGKAKVKPPRNICNRKMEFKIVIGTLLRNLNDDFFHHKFCIKHESQCNRGTYLDAMFSGAGACLTTDHSAFESSANAVNQSVCEQLVYRFCVPRKYWDLIALVCQPTWIVNDRTGLRILTDTVRYSGDVCTSLGNSLLNASSALAAYHSLVEELPELTEAERAYCDEVMASYGAACGRPLVAGGDPFAHKLATFDAMWKDFTTPPSTPLTTDLTFIVEGDDACVASPRLPDAEVYQAEMRRMGLNVTIEGAGDISKAGFCQVFWNEIMGKQVTYCDVKNQILTSRWSSHPPTKRLSKMELYKSKLMSLCQQFPGCPVVWKLLEGVTTMAVDDNAYEVNCLEAQGLRYKRYGPHLIAEVAPVSEPTPEQRALFSELYGITPDAQRELEKDPVNGVNRLLCMLMSTSEANMYEEVGRQTASQKRTDGSVSTVYKF